LWYDSKVEKLKITAITSKTPLTQHTVGSIDTLTIFPFSPPVQIIHIIFLKYGHKVVTQKEASQKQNG